MFAELNDRERTLLAHVAAVMDRTGKPVLGVPLTPLDRSVFPGLGGFAPVLLPTPSAAVRALAAATWYATHTDAAVSDSLAGHHRSPHSSERTSDGAVA